MGGKETQLLFANVGINDHIPYSKADIVKVSRVSDNFAISFYQIDYQAMAVNLNMPAPAVEAGKATTKDATSFLIPVGKIVLDKSGFDQLNSEIEQIKKLMAN